MAPRQRRKSPPMSAYVSIRQHAPAYVSILSNLGTPSTSQEPTYICSCDVYIYIYRYAYITRAHIYLYVWMHVSLCVCVFVCVCVYAYIRTYIHTYIRHAQTHIPHPGAEGESRRARRSSRGTTAAGQQLRSQSSYPFPLVSVPVSVSVLCLRVCV